MCGDILDLAQVTHTNITKQVVEQMLNENRCGEHQIQINENYKNEIENYYQKFL